MVRKDADCRKQYQTSTDGEAYLTTEQAEAYCEELDFPRGITTAGTRLSHLGQLHRYCMELVSKAMVPNVPPASTISPTFNLMCLSPKSA